MLVADACPFSKASDLRKLTKEIEKTSEHFHFAITVLVR